MNLDDAADDLYGADPAEFIARRKALVAEAKAAGDAALGARIAGLRKPTQVAWAINRWVRAEPDQVADLAELAADLAGAQRRSAAAEIRSLSVRRSAMIDGTASSIIAVAADAGVSLSANAVREVTQTLRAAAADVEVLDRLRRGRLEASAHYSGFGPASVFVVPDAAPDAEDEGDTDELRWTRAGSEDAAASGVGDGTADVAAQQLRLARDERDAAQATLDHAREIAQSAADDLAALRSSTTALEERRADLKAQLGHVDDELRFVRKQAESVQAASTVATDDLREAQSDFDAATAHLRALESGQS